MRSIKPLNIDASPTVNMITNISGSPMSGRRKNRSIRNPRIKQPARVTKKATAIGNFADVTIARKKNAPRAKSSPWAKLRTLDDLKIITNPIADSPYKNPILKPFMRS
jgi:hypothetical protein